MRFTLSQEELEWGERDIHSHLLGPFLSLGMETPPSGLGDVLIDNDNSEGQLLGQGVWGAQGGRYSSLGEWWLRKGSRR